MTIKNIAPALARIALIIGLGFATFVRADDLQSSAPMKELAEIKERFAPDKRLELFDYQFIGEESEKRVEVETTSPDAHAAVKLLAEKRPDWKISVTLLPEENDELDGRWRALVRFSVIQLRVAPDYSAECGTQALMGAPLRVLKKAGKGWLLVQNFDGYLGYTTAGSVVRLSENEFHAWREAPRLVCTANYGEILLAPSPDSPSISDLAPNDVLVWKDQKTDGDYYQVETPDGRVGWVLRSALMEWNEWLATRKLTAENVIASARRLLGRPYVWGGTSAKGVDCSGLVNFAFYTNGYNILRDVSQIQREGVDLDVSQGWKNLIPGDLLLFGARRADGSLRLRHVGIYIGDGRFIHSATYVHESSLDPNSPDYDEGNATELQKAVRMIGAPETPHFHPISSNAFFNL